MPNLVYCHKVFIPNWRPYSLNEIMKGHWSKGAAKKTEDMEMMAPYFRNIAEAEGKRIVHLKMILEGQQKEYDEDNCWKSLLDGLVKLGMLIDDNSKWRGKGEVTYGRTNDGVHTEAGTWIYLEETEGRLPTYRTGQAGGVPNSHTAMPTQHHQPAE